MASKKPNQQGLAVENNPLAETRAAGEKPAQQQPWPGSEKGMRPPADHGEQSYQGANKLLGKKALITGGDSGIGRAVAIAFAREGADVAIAYFDEREDAQETMRWVKEAGRKGLAIQGDLSQREHCREVIRQVVEDFGGIDILVNNAARQKATESLAEITPEQLEQTFRTNFFAMIWLCQATLEHMPEGGVILNTGSVQGFSPSPTLIDYAATKAAIHNFTKSLAQAVAERGIRVNCVSPGPVWTPLIVSTMDAESIKSFGTSSIWKRPAQPAEIAPSYVFLASADGRYYTGEILAPTGSETSR
jgi:NAD(P)-dependent dehydrogenase (short-subunit alcohol dehydrogenase family)